MRLFLAIISLLAGGTALAAEAPGVTLTGDTSHPDMSLFIPGEPVRLTFQAKGLKPNEAGLELLLDYVDEQDRPIASRKVPVQAGADGTWQATVDAPNERLGFTRVRAKLSNGVPLAPVGSRSEGYLTYAVVPDPAKRPLYPQRETFFGMQGGWRPKTNVLPYLGIRWVLGGYGWRDYEPDRAGQFAAKLAERKGRPQTKPAWETQEKPWRTYRIPTLFFAPKWAVKPETASYCTGTLTPEGEKAWREYCLAAARARIEEEPDAPERIYQITWEPVYPWGFKGSDEDLIRIYAIAYPAIHEADPKAVVVGPTGAGISRGDIEWNTTLLKKGIWKYVDAYSIHPYHPIPPERLGLVERCRELKETVRQYAGRDLQLLGTEQGSPTGEDPAKELDQARGLLRQNLILMGEGFRLNFAFYIVDYPTEPGYGYFYNLVPKKPIPWGPEKIGPKPIAPAYAFQSFLLEGHRSAGSIEWLGDTALGYAYERGDHVVLALWDYGDAPRTVSVPVGVKQVAVYDWMGNRRVLATPDERARLTLGPEPIYVEGAAASLWGSKAAKPVRLKATRLVSYPGGRVQVTGDMGTAAALQSTLRCEADPRLGVAPLTRKAALAPGKRVPYTLELSVPADAEPGTYPVKVTLAGPRGAVGVCGAMLSVRPPLAIQGVEPVVTDAGEEGIRIALRNDTRAVQSGVLTVRLKGIPETTRTERFRVPAGGESIVTFAYPGLDVPASRTATALVSIHLDGGYRFAQDAAVTFLAAVKLIPVADARSPLIPPTLGGSGGAVVRPVALRGREAVVRSPQEYRGASDLSANLRFAWDERCLYLAAEVTDDVFLQANTGFNTWKGDCLQVGFDLDPGKAESATGNLLADAGSKHRASEIDLALTTNGPEAYRTITFDKEKLPVRLLTREELSLAVTRGEGGLAYAAAIPWATLGLAAAPKPGDRIGIAVTVNDMDDAKQFDPKAVGLFGGITPAKDPGKYGVLVLAGPTVAPPSPPRSGGSGGGTAPAPTLRLSGVLGQSQPAGQEPLPFIGCTGAAVDGKGRLWTFAGSYLYGFAAVAAPPSSPNLGGVGGATAPRTPWTCVARQALPAGVGSPGACWDGERFFFASGDGRVYSTVPGEGEAKPVGSLRLGEKVRSFTAAPAGLTRGFAAKAKLFVLNGDAVEGFTADGTSAGTLLTLTRPAGASWWYCAVGIEPATGDLLVGSYYPDSKVYRFEVGGEPFTRDGWPRGGHASVLPALGEMAWIVELGGVARPLPQVQGRGATGPSFGGPGTMYASGVAREASGAYWIATSQGLVRFDAKGRPTGERLGGIAGVRSLAIATDGTVVAAVENGQRMLRLALDDAPNAAFPCNANEPWRAANGWTHRSCALAWDAGRFLVADEVGKQLWGFDPWHTGWRETPWQKLTEPNTLAAPRAAAVGDTLAWVLDGKAVREVSIRDLAAKEVSLPGLPDAAAAIALAASGDRLLCLGLQDRVLAFRRAADGSYHAAWEASGVKGLAGLAASDGFVVVSGREARTVFLLDAETGKVVTKLGADSVPGGMLPGAVAARGPWLLAADEAGKRLLRLRH